MIKNNRKRPRRSRSETVPFRAALLHRTLLGIRSGHCVSSEITDFNVKKEADLPLGSGWKEVLSCTGDTFLVLGLWAPLISYTQSDSLGSRPAVQARPGAKGGGHRGGEGKLGNISYTSVRSKSGASGSMVENIITPTSSSFSAFLFPVFHSCKRESHEWSAESRATPVLLSSPADAAHRSSALLLLRERQVPRQPLCAVGQCPQHLTRHPAHEQGSCAARSLQAKSFLGEVTLAWFLSQELPIQTQWAETP